MDRSDLDERLELLRDDDPDVADARQIISENVEAARRWKKIKAFDAVVRAAVRDVAVPANFSDGVLARIGVQTAERKAKARRNYVLSGVGSALVLSLLIGLFISRWPDPGFTRQRVTEAAAKVFAERSALPASTDETPKLPQGVGIRGGIAGFDEIKFLKKDAVVYRLELPAGDHPVAIIVPAVWFPADFDWSASYAIAGDVALEVRFIRFDNDEQYCIFVAANPKAFEAKALIF
jgi:hypothetical protein